MFKYKDPFSYKSFSKLNPIRLVYTAWIRWQERISRQNYDSYAMEMKKLNGYENNFPEFNKNNTAVTEAQMNQLLTALRLTEKMDDTCVVEIGAYRGETSVCLASETKRRLFCIDPYIGYGGAEDDYIIFKDKTAGYDNITHLKMTSGEARKEWDEDQSASLIFIDAVHDYANTSFDINTWQSVLCKGGYLALHDVDQKAFAGTRRAAYECRKSMNLAAHVDNLAIFKKINS